MRWTMVFVRVHLPAGPATAQSSAGLERPG